MEITWSAGRGSGLSNELRYRARNTSFDTMSCHPESFQSSAFCSGYTSISFTTKSASVPVVATNRFAITSPAIVTSSVRTSLSQLSTSGRSSTKRWSSNSQSHHSEPSGKYVASIGRCR